MKVGEEFLHYLENQRFMRDHIYVPALKIFLAHMIPMYLIMFYIIGQQIWAKL